MPLQLADMLLLNGPSPIMQNNLEPNMLKHSYHARLSIWHVVLLVIILAISLPVVV